MFETLGVRSTLLLLLFSSVCASLGAASSVGAQGTTAEVLEAWTTRRSRIQTFEYECSVTRTEPKGTRNKTADPFNQTPDTDIPHKDVVLEGTFTFTVSDGQFAYYIDSDTWNEQDNAMDSLRHVLIYDGDENKRFVRQEENGTLPLGFTEASANAHRDLRAHVNLTGLWLWYQPTVPLQTLGYRPSKGAMHTERVFREGTECLELTFAKPGGHWTARVCVDPSRDYLPVQFVEEYDKAVMRDLTIGYTADDDVGWRVARFEGSWLDQSGRQDKSVTCEVQRYSINTVISKDAFTIEFPEGTHVAQRDEGGVRYLLSLGDGQFREISEDEYAVVPTEPRSASAWPDLQSPATACSRET